MTISAQIIADSMSPAGIRLTTFQLRYPRFIHAELMTHRVFSRNASSSRAIPVQRMIEDIRRDPAMPVYWGANRSGMQAVEELSPDEIEAAKVAWLEGLDHATDVVFKMMELGLHKQIANRILEPWAHINVVVTATEWNNFYTLRRHKDAQPEIKALADAMWEAHETGPMPVQLQPGEWHLPYINLNEDLARLLVHAETFGNPDRKQESAVELAKRVSVARCARVSYLTHDGRQTTIEEDLQLYSRLLGAQPLHASPAEHQATPDEGIQHGFNINWMHPEEHGNLTGWRQYRKMLDGEFVAG